MVRSRMVQAVLIGCLAALAGFCALQAGAEETYSIVAQSTASSAATGRRPLGERIAAANLPIITRSDSTAPAASTRNTVAKREVVGRQETTRPHDIRRNQDRTAGPLQGNDENMAVSAVDVDRAEADAAAAQPAPAAPKLRLPTPPVRWPFATRQPAAIARQEAASSQKRPAPAGPPAATAKQRQTTARSSGKGLSSSSPASVTR